MRWVRSAADSSKRRCVPNPRKEWITRQDERLRIVSDDLWQRAQARQAEQSRRIGEGVRRGLSKGAAIRAGTGNKFLLSGLLRCAHCGSSYSMRGVDRYACSGHTTGGDALCANDATIRRQWAEAEVTAGIKRDLTCPVVIEDLCRRVRALLRRQPKAQATTPDNTARIAALRAQVENLADAVASGAFRSSPALAKRLAAAEEELAQLEAVRAQTDTPAVNVERLLADLPARAARSLERLEETLAAGDLPAARQEIKAHVGTVSVEADKQEIRLWSEQGVAASLLRAAGGSRCSFVGSGGALHQLSKRGSDLRPGPR
jgi:hypothetical protein